MLNFRFIRDASMITGLDTYEAKSRGWQFVMIHDLVGWTISYRQVNPRRPVSASSTIQGPFATREEAETAANSKLDELRRMA